MLVESILNLAHLWWLVRSVVNKYKKEGKNMKSTFNKVKESKFKTLEQYVPIVARVHGANHPEFHEVHKVFDTIVKKTKEAGSNKPELKEEFTKLREITDNYTIPDDVCESYEAVYNMLEEVDKSYQA